MNCVLIGYGEVGSAVYEVFAAHHNIGVCDHAKGLLPADCAYDVLLVAIPYSNSFAETICEYKRQFNASAVIIFSTVAIGTTAQIPDAVHSPVEGRHPKLAESIKLMRRWVGGYNPTAHRFFAESGVRPYFLPSPNHTEFLKLRSTSKYGINIEWARYEKEVCDKIGLGFDAVKMFDHDYNKLYESLLMPDFQRYILSPPIGNIGGHCVVPNAELLDNQFPSVFLKEIYRDKEGGHA